MTKKFGPRIGARAGGIPKARSRHKKRPGNTDFHSTNRFGIVKRGQVYQLLSIFGDKAYKRWQCVA